MATQNIAPLKPAEQPLGGYMSKLQDETDEVLVQSYLDTGSKDVFAQIVSRYEREIYAFFRRFFADENLAADAFQATFLMVHLRLDQFEPGRRFRPWLYAIATNKAIDLKRQLKRRSHLSLESTKLSDNGDSQSSLAATLPDREKDPVSAAIRFEQADRVREIISEMNEPTQQLLHMVYYQGLKYSDIGEALGIPVGTVKSRVFNTIRKLNEVWHRKFPNSEPPFDQ